MQTKHGFEVVRIDEQVSPSGASQVIWNVHPPVRWGADYDNDGAPEGETVYVMTSAVFVSFSGDETYIFPCDKKGEWLDAMEMPGSFKGGLDHETAIMGLNHSDYWKSDNA